MYSKKAGGRRNFGFGRSIRYAARCAIEDRYGRGRFGTVAAVRMRAMRFVAFVGSLGISDFRFVDLTVIYAYAASLKSSVNSGRLSINTAVNYLSAVNCLMSALRSDTKVRVSPRLLIGARTFVRKVPPVGIDAVAVDVAVVNLTNNGEQALGAVLLLCRNLGLRFREASLLSISVALRQAQRDGVIRIVKGTKGGRPRTIAATAEVVDVLQIVKSAASSGRNLIPAGWTFIRWSRYCYRTWRRYADAVGLSSKFSDLRSAFACQLYREATGFQAPVLENGRLATGEVDRAARLKIAKALGHSRHQIAGPYVGTSLRPKK
jgi:hypothetical protein